MGLDGGNANDFGHMWDGWGMGWAGGWMMLVWILLLGLIVGGIVVLTRGDKGHEHGTQPLARDVPDLRYTRGEITQDEYLNARLVLDDAQPPEMMIPDPGDHRLAPGSVDDPRLRAGSHRRHGGCAVVGPSAVARPAVVGPGGVRQAAIQVVPFGSTTAADYATRRQPDASSWPAGSLAQIPEDLTSLQRDSSGWRSAETHALRGGRAPRHPLGHGQDSILGSL